MPVYLLKILSAIIFVICCGYILQGKDYFLFQKKYGRKETFGAMLKRKFLTGLKCLKMLVVPVPFMIATAYVWYDIFYKNNIDLNPKLEAIATAGWIPLLSILYSILVAIILNQLWSEYKAIRMAVKNYDLETFMNLRDEQMSPLVHTLMAVISGSVLVAFMLLKYPDAVSGVVCVSSVSYLFSLVFYVIVEIDDPCSGTWFIKSIPKEWLTIDSREWRNIRNNPAHQKFLEALKSKNETLFYKQIEEEKIITKLLSLVKTKKVLDDIE
jgi:hypothetical protein